MFYLRFYDYSHLNYFFALILVLPLVACSGDGSSGSSGSSLSWVAPSEREDNTGMTLSEIAGFRIYYGAESGSYSNTIDIVDRSVTRASLAGVPSGTYFVVMTTVDTEGRESSYSAPEIEVTF